MDELSTLYIYIEGSLNIESILAVVSVAIITVCIKIMMTCFHCVEIGGRNNIGSADFLASQVI